MSKSNEETDYYYYWQQALADKVLGEDAYDVLENYKVKIWNIKEYEPLYSCAAVCRKQNKKALMLYVIPM